MTELVTKIVIVKGKKDDIYQLWSDIERFPEFIEPLKSVSRTGLYSSLWTFTGRSGSELTWEAQMTQIDLHTRIAWNTLTGDITMSGQVTFQQLPKDETQVTIVIDYCFTDSTPETDHIGPQQVDALVAEYLRRFKAYAEDRILAPSYRNDR